MEDDQPDKREMPADIEAERAVLGSILIEPNSITDISDIITEKDFYDIKHQAVYQAISQLYHKNLDIDLITIVTQLKKDKKLDSVGGTDYLKELIDITPTAAHIKSYADIISQKSRLRSLIKFGQNTQRLGRDPDKEVDLIIEEAEAELFRISDHKFKSDLVKLEDVLEESFERLEKLHKNKADLRGIATDFKDLDNLLAGFQKSDLVIIAARPAMGKTAFALNLAYNISGRRSSKYAPKNVMYFSLEMSKDQLADRLIAIESGLNAWNIRTGHMKNSDFAKIGDSMGHLSDMPLYIDDSSGLNISELRTKTRRAVHKHQIDLVIVDYLQLMTGLRSSNGEHNRVQEITEISRGLKTLAREIEIPIIALSQLSRGVESRENRRPELSDLRDSGAIEQDADIVAFLYRDEYYRPETTAQPGILEVIVKKHRNGPIGKVKLLFKKETQRYHDTEGRIDEPSEE